MQSISKKPRKNETDSKTKSRIQFTTTYRNTQTKRNEKTFLQSLSKIVK